MEDRSTQEARRSPRFALRCRTWCEGDHVTLYLQSLNVSEGGLFLRTATPLPPGTRAVITIRVDGGDVIADAEVVWVATPGARVPGMGVRLVQIRQGAERLASLLARAASSLS
jgi:uncharacterized protein (TIGR02266 family)